MVCNIIIQSVIIAYIYISMLFQVLKKMHDLEEANDNMKSKVKLLQAQIKKLKAEQSQDKAQDLQKSVLKPAKSSPQLANPMQVTQRSEALESPEVIGSSQTQEPRLSDMPQVKSRAVTRMASTIKIPPANKSQQPSGVRTRRSLIQTVDENSLPEVLQSQGRKSLVADDDEMKRALKRVCASTSMSQEKRKRKSTVIPESPEAAVEGLPSKVKQGKK